MEKVKIITSVITTTEKELSELNKKYTKDMVKQRLSMQIGNYIEQEFDSLPILFTKNEEEMFLRNIEFRIKMIIIDEFYLSELLEKARLYDRLCTPVKL